MRNNILPRRFPFFSLAGYLLGVGFVLVSCNVIQRPSAQKGEWVLASYDENKGYTFRKDGSEYLARCIRLQVEKDGPSFDADSEIQCSKILAYLGKAVPGIDQAMIGDSFGRSSPASLTFHDQNGASYEFRIVEAKSEK